MNRYFEISGVLETDTDLDSALDAIIDLCEERGWLFGGTMKEVDENGEDLIK